MKKLLTICLVLIWVVSFGCKQEKIIPEISPGRDKLLLAGLAIDAIENHLKLAEIEEGNKDEPRALLLIGYSHALSMNLTWLKNNNMETEYRNERARRLKELNTSEMEELFKVLNHGYRVQKDTIQILIDKGIHVIPLILNDLIESRYSKAHDDFAYILTQIGSKGLDKFYTAVSSTDTPTSVKIKLIRIIADIGDASAQGKLEALKDTVSDAGLKMEINTALYQLGNKAYQKDIEVGLSDKNVVVRRAAARAVKMLNQPSKSKIADALKDTDDIVRRDAVKALQKHIYAEAVDILFDMLTNDLSSSTKQVVLNTLNQYAEIGKAEGLAQRLIVLLTRTEIVHHEDRLRIVQLLSKPALIKQIQEVDPFENLQHKLFDYFDTKETNKMVKDELNAVLLELEK
jgi:HEAT repeat protein